MGKKQVLIVDDSDFFREIISELLTRRGYHVLQAKDGLEALQLATSNLDLMLLDLLLPKMTGFDVLRELRNHEETRSLQVLAVSGVFREENSLQALRDLGARGFISKTLSPQEIADQVTEVLEGRSPEGTRQVQDEISGEWTWKKPFPEDADVLGRMKLFQGLSPEQKKKILSVSKRVKFFREQTILQEGETGEEFYGIIRGRVRVEKSGLAEKPTVIARLGPGDQFGELALIDAGRRSATCKAETEVEALELNREQFESLLREDPDLERKCLRALLQIVTQRLRETDTRLTYSRLLLEKITES